MTAHFLELYNWLVLAAARPTRKGHSERQVISLGGKMELHSSLTGKAMTIHEEA